ncbi:hypothetical protein K9N08_02445 [Candidatus Gracilibacteria bacterium]|nr:hypothetical protein [Candidatus Gracilibacteria bacterium]MCF7856395.1 hypothetical protein [Candidatus Gracilibacteria bacterium]MCF7896809.1 hypothetical protein [Candidatus Gracilibacteria bacterium]
MHDSQTITNEILNGKLDLVLKILEQHDKRFEQMDKRFEQQDKRLDRMEDDRREDHRLLQQIHESRHEVKVQFHWKLAAASVAISSGVSVVVFLAMSSLMGGLQK